MTGPYVIGVDAGTESLRAGVFDLAGTPLAFAATPYETKFPHPGWAEQDPRDWWQALGRSVRHTVAEAAVASDSGQYPQQSNGIVYLYNIAISLLHGNEHKENNFLVLFLFFFVFL